MKEIEIPEGVVTIGSFEYCSSLSRVKIPASVSGMYFYAFRHCFIAYFEVDENNRHYSSDSVGSLFNKDQTVLIRVAGGGDTYSSWVGLYGYHLPNTVGYIAEGACSGVQPQYNITMTLPKSVTNIAANAISHCLRVKIYVASDNECFKSDAYGDAIYNSDGTVLISYHGNDSHFTVPSSVTNIAYLAFMGSIGLNTVTIPDSVTSVGQFAFCWCEDLESVTLPKNVETLDWTFAQCSNLKKVVMPDGSKIKNLFDGMFQFCSNLTEVVLTEGVERIVGPVFWNCRSLPELIIPESVKEFSGSSECFALTNLSFKGAPPKLWSGRKFDDSHLAIGYYRAKYASEWQAALDSEGKYAGIPMFQRAMVTNKVTFVVGDKGLHTGGGSLEQDVFDETAAESPLITANEGWRFVGWDADISNVISNTTVNAVYKRDLITVVPFEEDVAFDGSVANVYDGWLVDENGDLAGIVQVKAAKQTVKKGVANFTATATVTDLNGKKWSYSKGVGAADGVVAGLSCTAKGVPVTSFNVSLGGNSLSGEYGKCKIIGARNGMGIKGDPMKVSLEEHYLQKNYSLAFENEDGISRLQFIVGAKGVVKIAGQVPGGFKMNASVQGVMGEDALYIPCCAILKNGKNNKNVMILARIKNDGSVEILDNNLGNVLAAGETQTFVSLVEGDVFYAHITQCKGGEEYNGTVVIPELSYPAKFSAKGLPSGLKIDAGTGVVTGTPKKPGKYLVEFTIVSGINSKSKIVFEYEFIVMNFSAANGCFKEGIRNAADEKYSLSAGVSNIADFLPNLALKSITAKLSVSGLPAGLKYDAKTGKITGIATKPGTYTVTLTVTDGKAKYVSTITIEVEALPDWVVGTFDGDSLGECAVSGSDYLGVSSLSVSSVGKITGKISFANAKTIPFALNGFTAIENDAYIARGVVKVGNIEYATEIEVERSAYSSSGSVVYKGGVDILMEANSNTDEGIPSIVECELEQNIWASKNHVLPIIDTKSTFYVAPDTDSEKTFSIKFGNKGVATVGYWADLSLSKMTKSGSVPVILVEYDSLNSIWHGQLVLNSITNVGIDNESPVVIDVYFDENGDVFFLCPEVSPMPLSWFAGTYTGSVYEDGILGSYSGSITAKIDAKGTISAVMDWDSGVRRNIKCTCAKIVNRNECKLTGKVNFEGYTFDVEIDINIDGTASMRAEAPIDRIWGDNLYKQE